MTIVAFGNVARKQFLAFLTVRVDVLPPLLPEAPSVCEEGSRLKVTIYKAENLRGGDVNLNLCETSMSFYFPQH